MTRHTGLLLALILALASSCATVMTDGKAGRRLDGGKAATTGAIRAEAVISSKGLGMKAKAAVLLDGPDRLSIEILGPFSSRLALIVGDGGAENGRAGIKIYSGDNRDTTLAESDKNANGFLGATNAFLSLLSTQELAEMLVGCTGCRAMNGYEVHTGDDGLVVAVKKRVGGDLIIHVDYSDYRLFDSTLFPGIVVMRFAEEELTLRYTDIETDAELDPEAFSAGNRLNGTSAAPDAKPIAEDGFDY